ncbi:MAG: ABC transporter permease [Rhodospirillales bacterium]|nr:ABC transporter permease [Rhodospirillales bacterium]
MAEYSTSDEMTGAGNEVLDINRPGLWQSNEQIILGSAFIIVTLLAWEIVPSLLTLSRGMKMFLATPSDVIGAFGELFDSGKIWPALSFSATAFGLGLGLSIIVALPLGVIMGRSRLLNDMFDPFITAINATPRLVFLPLILIWFGIGMWSVIVVVFIGALFPLLINTYEGVKNADRVLINVVKSYGASEWEINKLVVIPNSLPFIIAGLRLAIGRAVLGVVVAEFFGGSSKGIGVIMVRASGTFQVDVVFAGLIIFMTISLILTGVVRAIEARFNRWRPPKVKNF